MKYEDTGNGSYFRDTDQRMTYTQFRERYYRDSFVNYQTQNNSSSNDNYYSIPPIVTFILLCAGIAVAVSSVILSIYRIALYVMLTSIFLFGITLLLLPIKTTESTFTKALKNTIAILLIFIDVIAFVGVSTLGDSLNITGKTAIIAGALGMGIPALFLIIGSLIDVFVRKSKCSQTGIAYCIGYDDRMKNGSNFNLESAPVYKLSYNGYDYTIYNGKYYELETSLPKIGTPIEVKFNPEDPYQSSFGKQQSAPNILLIAGIVSFIVATLLGLASTRNYTPYKTEAIALTDRTIEQQFRYSGADSSSYVVCERTVIGISDDIVYFSSVGGLYEGLHMQDARNYNVGDTVLYIQPLTGSPLVYSTDKFFYEGEHTISNSDWYNDEGKFILTREYLIEYMGTEHYTITEISYLKKEDNKLDFIDDNHIIYTMNVDYDGYYAYVTLTPGDRYYWISCDTGTSVLSTEENTFQ